MSLVTSCSYDLPTAWHLSRLIVKNIREIRDILIKFLVITRSENRANFCEQMHPVPFLKSNESKVKKERTSSAITRTNTLTRLVRDDRNKSRCDSKSSRRRRIASV